MFYNNRNNLEGLNESPQDFNNDDRIVEFDEDDR